MQRRSFIKACFAGLGSFLLPRCGGDSSSGPDPDPEPEPTPDTTVQALFPANDHTVTNLDLRLRTSNRLDPDSIDDDAIYLTEIGSDNRISGVVSYSNIDSEKGELRFYEADLGEAGHLVFDTTYRLQVDPDIRDENGKPLSGATTFSFITRHSTKVSGFNYTIDAQGDLYATIALTHGLKGDSVNETTVALTEKETGTPVAGNILYNPARNEISIKLPETFDVAKEHTITLDGVLDFEGVPLDGDGNETAGGVYTNDFDVAPYVKNRTPADGTTNAARGTTVSALLSEDVTFKKNGAETTDLEGILTLTDRTTSQEVEGSVDYIVDNGDFKLQFTPSAPLNNTTGYTATIHSEYVFDANGNRMRNDDSWNFTTTSATDPAPGPITGFSGNKGSSPGQINLSWTTPEDFDVDGNPVSHELTYNLWYKEGAAYTPTEIANLSKSNANETNIAGGKEAGAADNYQLTGLNPATKHYIVMEAEDATGNTSERIQIENILSKGYTLDVRDLYELSTGAAATGFDVRVLAGQTEVTSGKTDNAGNITLEVPDNTVNINITKAGFIPRDVENYDTGTPLRDRVTDDEDALKITNYISRGADDENSLEAPNASKRWVTPPDEIIYNPSTEKTGGVEPDQKMYDTIKDILDNDMVLATDTHLYPGGFLKNVPFNNREIEYLDAVFSGEYIPGKIVVQYDQQFGGGARITSFTKNGQMDGAVITFGTLVSGDDRKAAIHELSKAIFRVERNSNTPGNVFYKNRNGNPSSITPGSMDEHILKAIYSAPNQLHAQDRTVF